MTWNLVHVITRMELGGAQLATLYELEHSRFATGRRYLVYGPGGILDSRARALTGVHRVEIPELSRELSPVRDRRAVSRMLGVLKQLRSGNPDSLWLVHTHSSKAGILGRLAARVAGADLVVHSIHGFGHSHVRPAGLRAMLLLAEQACAHLTDGFTADSAANLTQARAEAITGDLPTRVVRCGADLTRFASPATPPEAIRRELGIPEGHAVVLNVSCLKPQKDPESFVRLAAQVRRVRPQTTFILAGDGELRPSVETLIAALGLEEQVRLLGWRRDVPELLHACDLLVLTSLWEGLPQTFAQAMAARRPIVATRVDGAPEAVVHGQNGLLYETGDLAGMAAGIAGLLDDPARRTAMGARGFEAAGAFSQERMVRDLDDYYAELAVRTRPKRRQRVIQAQQQLCYWLEAGAALVAAKTSRHVGNTSQLD